MVNSQQSTPFSLIFFFFVFHGSLNLFQIFKTVKTLKYVLSFFVFRKAKGKKTYLFENLFAIDEGKVNHRRKDEDFFFSFLNDEFFVYLTIK